MRLMPQSLFGRLALAIVAGLVIAQLLGIALGLRDRREALHQAAFLHTAERIADAVRVLDALPPDRRPAALAALRAPMLQATLVEAPAAPASGARRLERLRFALRRHLPADRPFHVAAEGGAARPGPMHRRDDLAFQTERPPAITRLRVEVALAGGGWVRFDTHLPDPRGDWPWRLALQVGLVVLLTLALTLLVVRWLNRPLQRLAQAADQLGRDLRADPVPEEGPQEVRRAALAFNRMQERLRRYLDDRTRVLTAVSHDLKTPITRLRLRAEMLDDPAQQARFTADLDDMERMVQGTLDFLRGLSADEPLQPVDVQALLETLVADAAERGATVTLVGSVVSPLRARPLALKRCIANLLDNALAYGREVGIAVTDGVDALDICIRDRGPGIPEGDLERVFEPFHRLEGSRARATGGTGLGLGIARNLARLHGGDVTLANRAGGGLEARLHLPR